MLSLYQIDARIEEPSEEIRTLRSLRNSHAGVCRLPEELLLDILQYNSGIWASWKDTIRMTHVCRHLRISVLAMHGLWADIPEASGHVKRQEIFETYLARAGNAPLSLYVAFGDHAPFVMEATKLHLNHVKSLFVNLDYQGEAEASMSFVDHLYAHPAPLLQQLRLRQRDNLSSEPEELDRGRPISSDLLGGARVQLTTLGLSHVTLENLPPAPQLTKLELGHTRSTIRQFHGVLTRLLALRDLSLNPEFMMEEDETFVATPVMLPDLRSLSIESDSKTIDRLLGFLPDPKEEFDLFREGDGKEDGVSPWMERLPANQAIIARLNKWWQSHTGKQSLPTALVWVQYLHEDRSDELLEALHDAGEPEVPGQYLVFRIQETFFDKATGRSAYICFSNAIDCVRNPDLFLLRVRELSMCLDDCHDSIDVRNDMDLHLLTALTHVLINNTRVACHDSWQEAPGLGGIVDWLVTRRAEGTLLDSIVFSDCDESMRPMLRYLVDEQLAKVIEWY
jgi:hypothetical protein